jgi:hypothetical protein
MRRVAVVSLLALSLLSLPNAAVAASQEVDVECDSAGAGYKLLLLGVAIQETIAEGRTAVDVIATIRVSGVATFSVNANGLTVGSAQVSKDPLSYADDERWITIGGLPTRGNLELVVSFAPTSELWNPYSCPTLTIPIKRTTGIPLLGRWEYRSDASREAVFTEMAEWGKFTYIESTDRVKWVRGSCQNLTVAPIIISIESTGVAGSMISRTSVRDQCELVPPANVARKKRVLAGTIAIATGRVIVSSTLRKAGEQRYKVTLSIGSTRRSFNRTAIFQPSFRIWEGTDAFWNTCISDSRDIRSDGGRLYCVEAASLSM